MMFETRLSKLERENISREVDRIFNISYVHRSGDEFEFSHSMAREDIVDLIEAKMIEARND